MDTRARILVRKRGARPVLAAMLALSTAACALPPPDPFRVAEQCEERARAAQGPTGEVTIGANSETGGFGGVAIGITSDYLRGADPVAVYEDCVFRRTGAAPVRPPALRAN